MSPNTHLAYHMMIKRQALEEIKEAHIAHSRWIRRIGHLVDNMPVTANSFTLNSSKCPLGKWIASNEVKYKQLSELETIFNHINSKYIEAHKLFNLIYSIYFPQKQSTWLNSFLPVHSTHKVTKRQHAIAKEHYRCLANISDELLRHLDNFANHLAIQKEETFIALY